MGHKNKEKIREWKREREMEDCREAIATPRRYDEEMHFPGVGLLRARIVVKPSWEPLCCWEVSETDRLVVYGSQAVEGCPDLVVGFTPLAIASDDLASHLRDIASLQLPLMDEHWRAAVLDGTRLLIRLAGGIDSSSQFQWVQGHPPRGWTLLENHTLSLVSRLRSATVHEDTG